MSDRAPAGAVRGRWAPPSYLLLAAAALFWASNLVIGRAVAGEIPPIALNFWRWVLALAIVLPFTAAELLRYRAVLVLHWRILVLLGLTGIGSGGNFAYAAARALLDTDMSAEEIARRAMAIAAEICVYTNDQLVVESLDAE